MSQISGGASGRNRTDTSMKIMDFESIASTNSATEARVKLRILREFFACFFEEG